MKRHRLSAKARQKQMDSLRDIAIFALEPTQGMSTLNELAAYNKQAIPRLVEITNSFKTDIEVRLAAKHLIGRIQVATKIT